MSKWSFKKTTPEDHENPSDWREGEYVIFKPDGNPAAVTDNFNDALWITTACNTQQERTQTDGKR